MGTVSIIPVSTTSHRGMYGKCAPEPRLKLCRRGLQGWTWGRRPQGWTTRWWQGGPDSTACCPTDLVQVLR